MLSRTTAALLLTITAAAQTPGFAALERDHFVPDPGPTTAAATADVDGDGHADVLFVAGHPPTLLYYHNDGHAVFTAMPLQLPAVPLALPVAADIDGDGDDDLLLIGNGPSCAQPSMLRNQGNGVFTADVQPALAGWACLQATFVDVDGDGDVDLLGWGRRQQGVTAFFLFLNDGAGRYTDVSAQAFPGGATTPFQVCFAIDDFDHDGRADIVVSSGTGIDLLRNDGNGTFRRESAVVPRLIFGMISGDVDGDGYPDLLVDVLSSLLSPTRMLLATNDRTGHFIFDDAHPIDPTANTSGGRLVDLDGDGRNDLLLADGRWRHHDAQGFGSWRALAMPFDIGPSSVTDLNGDLLPDLLGAGRHPHLLLGTDGIAVDRACADSTLAEDGVFASPVELRHTPDGDFAAVQQPIVDVGRNLIGWRPVFVDVRAAAGERPRLIASTGPPAAWAPTSVAVAEFRLHVGGSLWTTIGMLWTDGALHLGFANGAQLQEATGLLPDPGAPVLLARAGRLFRDDCDDIVVVTGSTTQPALLLYSLVGTSYKKTAVPLPAGTRVADLRLADIDGDGDLDVICGTAVLRNDATFRMTPVFDLSPLLGASLGSMLAFDMDGDGDADILTAAGQLLESTPAGYRDVTLGRLPLGLQLHNLSAGDIDGDGDLDVMAVDSVLRNDGQRFTRFAGVAHTGTLIDLDHHGDASVFDGNEFWFGTHNRLYAPFLPQLGADYEARVATWRQGAAATLAVLLFGTALDSRRWPVVDVDPATALALPLPLSGGDGAWRVHVPRAAVLHGARFYLQAVTFDGMRAQPTNVLAEQIR